MTLQFLRVQNLMYFRSNHVHPSENDNPESKLTISAAENSESVESNGNESGLTSASRRCTICPVCILPAVVAFIFIFTIVQLIIIHHTLESYKLREKAYEDCYYPHGHHNSGPQPRHEEHVVLEKFEHEHNHPNNPTLQSVQGYHVALAATKDPDKNLVEIPGNGADKKKTPSIVPASVATQQKNLIETHDKMSSTI